MNVIVVGSSGAIGSAIVAKLLQDSSVTELHCWSRLSPDQQLGEIAVADSRIVHGFIDLAVPESIEQAAKAIEPDSIDRVIVASGLLHNQQFQPEKSLRQLTPEQFKQSMQINALGPALLAQQLLPRMRRHERAVFSMLSARVGSISDNRLGGWYSYRSSKAALNMLLRCMALEYRRTHPHLVIAGLHPGTVDSRLSEPFQRNVPEHKLFTPAYAAERLLAVTEGLSSDDSGNLFAWDGQAIDP